MTRKMIAGQILLAVFITLGFRIASQKGAATPPVLSRADVYLGRMVMGCSPDWQVLNTDSLGLTMGALPGWGTYQWTINSDSDSARFYFNQGINMYYAFHIIEAMASFKKAQRFDENNPMLYWAQALAYGPNINDFAYATVPDAVAAAAKASALSATATQKEKALISAMQVRYSADTTLTRKELNQRYADAMKIVYNEFKDDPDAGTLYADALMLQHPWEYWKHDGKPHPWTPAIVSVLETVLKQHPGQPGANHYYIHMLEASPAPGKALASADRLLNMMPNVSHMVHMPSHIYIRTGNYSKGIVSNERALKGYTQYKALYPDVINNAFLYAIHNYHMKAACAMMQPNYQNSLKAANECISSFDSSFLSLPHPLGNAIQYLYLTTQMVNVRYGKWSEVLNAPPLHLNYSFGFLLDQWARGLAHANQGDLAAAATALKHMEKALQHPDLRIRMEPFNIPYDQASVAQKILEGTIAEKKKNMPDAIAFYTAAVIAEDKLIYTEPRDWLIPTRHYLANALIKDRQYSKAEKVLKEDLRINPHNFYALRGLALIEQQRKSNRTHAYSKQLDVAFKNTDMRSPALIYE